MRTDRLFTASRQANRRLVVLPVALILAGCGSETSPPAAGARNSGVHALVVDWRSPGLRMELEKGWSLQRCPADKPTLCVDLAGQPAGKIEFHDLPTLGEEMTTSAEQVQAVLAGRLLTIYKDLKELRKEQCGAEYRLEEMTPRVVTMAGRPAMKYSATGFFRERPQEKIVGYRLFRSGIESQIEARAIEAGGCLSGEDGLFSVDKLRAFAPQLDRIAAGSRLPSPTRFKAKPGMTRPSHPKR